MICPLVLFGIVAAWLLGSAYRWTMTGDDDDDAPAPAWGWVILAWFGGLALFVLCLGAAVRWAGVHGFARDLVLSAERVVLGVWKVTVGPLFALLKALISPIGAVLG
jgi:hypothetical protein